MKPTLLKVPTQIEYSFSIRKDIGKRFYHLWHYHPEAELTWIQQGRGTRLVGDRIENFREGDLILLGSQLPHMWRSDGIYYREDSEQKAEAVVLHFREDFLGSSFFQLPEMKILKDLLEKAKRGLKISGATQQEVSRYMSQLFDLEGIDRITVLLSILKTIALSKETEVLSGASFHFSYDEVDTQRINQIYAYTLHHFGNPITIEEIAAVANISPHSFCRYFKAKTRKTFFQFLHEVRIGHACKLLIEDKLSISQICYESGFTNVAHFNRKFKEMIRTTPLQYKKQYNVGRALIKL
jgi:AraC-like DNA-binding protein